MSSSGAARPDAFLAARLSQDPDCRVLLLEAGPELDPAAVRTPGAALQLLGGDAVYGDQSVPPGSGRQTGDLASHRPRPGRRKLREHPHLVSRAPRGLRRVGARAGAEGWGWDEMLPIVRRVEHHVLGRRRLPRRGAAR